VILSTIRFRAKDGFTTDSIIETVVFAGESLACHAKAQKMTNKKSRESLANQSETLGSPYASPRAEWLVRNLLGCHHGLTWAEYCAECEIVGLKQTYSTAMRRAENARQRLMAMGEVVNDQNVRADVRATPKVAVATSKIAQEPSLWLAINHAGRVKYTTDRERAAKWAASSEYKIVRDYYASNTAECKSVNAAAIRARSDK